jgi:hypothetical protein
MKVLMIDGPMKGRVHEDVDSRVIRCLDYGAIAPGTFADVPVRAYYVHKYVVAGRMLLLGSMDLVPGAALADDVFWEFLASDVARELAQPAQPAGIGGEGGQS